MDPWPMIEADREALADYLDDLSAEDWDRPSLCQGWSVAEVTAHLLVVPTVPKGRIFLTFAGSGFNLDRFSAKMVARLTSTMSTDELAGAIRESAASHNVPPGLKPPGVLAEVLVHSTDISEALDRPLEFPVDHYVAAMDHLKDVQSALGCKKRIAGLELRATDAEWSTGDGALVEGPVRSLASAMTGRAAVLEHLRGEGVDTLRAR
jgi:uncharacterized protein (TIGR03083 family)